MKSLRYIIFILSALLFLGRASAGSRDTVSTAGTIASGFESMNSGDTLVILSGTYTMTNASQLTVDAKTGLVIMGQGRGSTIIDFNGKRGFYLKNASQAIFKDLTIKNATVVGGILLHGKLDFNDDFEEEIFYASTYLDSVEIDGCSGNFGGGVGAQNDYTYLEGVLNCSFNNNSSNAGGGAILAKNVVDALEITGSVFSNNSSTAEGGAIRFPNVTAAVSLLDCKFDDNQASDKGGALYFEGISANMSIKRTELKNNTSVGEGSAFYMDEINAELTFENNAIFNNSGGYAVWLDEYSGSAHSINVKNNSVALNADGGIKFQSAFSGYSGGIHNNIFADNNANGDYDVTSTLATDLGGNYNFVEDAHSNVTFSGLHNKVGSDADYYIISNDSLFNSSECIPCVLGVLPSGTYPELDVYGNTRDTIRSDVGAIEIDLDTIAFWTGGAANKDWSDAGNWKNFRKPEVSGASVSPYTDIYLTYCNTTNYPVVGSGVNLTNKGRFDKAEIIVGDTAIFKNEGTIKIKGITVESSLDEGAKVSYNGQYVTTGNITITGTQKYEQALIDTAWNFICVPEDVTADDLLPSNTFGGSWSEGSASGEYWISRYSDTLRSDNGFGNNWVQLENGTDVLEAGRGYLIWVDASLTIEFDTIPGDKSVDLSYYKGFQDSTHWGWNLLGNPYAIALDADDIIANADNDTNTVGGLYWHNGSHYVSRSAEGVGNAEFIPAHQAFFVQADTGLNYQVQTNNAVYRDDVVFKSSSVVSRQLMKITLQDDSQRSYNTYLQIKEASTDGFDSKSDAYELSVMSNAQAVIYSELNGIEYSVNTTPFEGSFKKIPLRVKIASDVSSFNLKFDLEGFEDVNVYLYDKVSGERTKIYDEDYLTIDVVSSVASYSDRYEIEYRTGDVVTTLSESTGDANNDLALYFDDAELVINASDALTPIRLEAYDLLGKLVVQKIITGGYGTVRGLKPGLYVVRLAQGVKIETRKVLVR